MKDVRHSILYSLTNVLADVGLPVWSYVPNNTEEPYIFIGDIDTQQLGNKDEFRIGGTFSVELYTGSNEWKGSLETPLEWLYKIKQTLQPNVSSVLELNTIFDMTYLTLEFDSGIQQSTDTKRIYFAQMTYSFETIENQSYVDRVEEDGGTMEAETCLPFQLV